jgi:hypothetical protein
MIGVWSVPLFTIEETQERDQLAKQGSRLDSGSFSELCAGARAFLLWTKLQRSLHLTWRKEICFFNWSWFLFLLHSHQPHHTTPHSPCCVPMIFDGSSHFKNSVPRHSPGPVFMEPAAAVAGAVIELTRRKLLTLSTGHTLVVISVACCPSLPRLPLSSLHERGEAVWLTLLFHSDPSQETPSPPHIRGA